MIRLLLVFAVLVVLTGTASGCGSDAIGQSPPSTATAVGGEAAVALRYLRRVSSEGWQSAADLELPGVRSDVIDREIHQNIRNLRLKLVAKPAVDGDRVTLHLRGKQSLEIRKVFVGTRYSTMDVGLTLQRVATGWKIASVEQQTGGRIVPPKH